VFFYLSRRRRRTFHAQVTHVLTRCIRLADDTIALEQSSPQIWHHMTVWSVAKELLTRRWPGVTLKICHHRNRDRSTVLPFCPVPLLPLVVWPGVFRAPKISRDTGPDIEGRARAPRRKTVPIVKVPPHRTALLPHGAYDVAATALRESAGPSRPDRRARPREPLPPPLVGGAVAVPESDDGEDTSDSDEVLTTPTSRVACTGPIYRYILSWTGSQSIR